jgi:HTH-type transcriptional regulator / antitoxin HigA
MTNLLQTFTPDWISPPGETIADLLEEREWTQSDLAKRLGYSEKHISLLINGKASITEETALRLENVLGSTTNFWLVREAQYRVKLAQQGPQADSLQQWVLWLDELPVRELMNQGAIPKRRIDTINKPIIVQDLLRFFGVASPDDWRNFYVDMEVSFRRTRIEQTNVGSISAWLRQGEIQAEKLNSPKYNKSKFEGAVQEIRKLTLLSSEEFVPQMQRLCRDAGVLLLLVPSIPGAHASGVARWLNAHKALIQLSLYGKTNDRFWFTFFHEAAHILLHSKKDIFLDEFGKGTTVESLQEEEANQWANEFLIPPQYKGELTRLRSAQAVQDFAAQIGIHPGIVVGRLQHDDSIEKSWMNSLKQHLDSNLLFPHSEQLSEDGQEGAECF